MAFRKYFADAGGTVADGEEEENPDGSSSNGSGSTASGRGRFSRRQLLTAAVGVGVGALLFVGDWAGATVLDELFAKGKDATTDPINAAPWQEALVAQGPYSHSRHQFVLPLTRAQVD